MASWLPRLFPQYALRAEDVLNERIRLESISTAIGAIGIMLIAYVTYLIFPADIPRVRYMGYWLTSQLLANSCWLVFIAHHTRYKLQRTRHLWPYLSSMICSFNGFIWGAGWVFFVGDATIEHAHAAVTFTIILGGVFTGGVLATIFHLPSLVSFMFCSLLPALVGTFIDDGIFHVWFGVTIIVYMLACTAFALNLHHFLMETLAQREEKSWLAQQLETEKHKAEQANQEKSRFLAAISHDLRQPLQALQFFQQSLRETCSATHQAQHILGGVEASVTALNGLLNAMLDVAQLDAGQHPIRRSSFPLNTLLRRIHQQYTSLAEEAGIRLHYISTSLHIDSDPMLLERIVQNLVHNAIKHMGRPGRILLGGRRQAGFVRIEIHDNGVGIPLQEQESVFQEFYQLHNPERNRSHGLGLGLAIVKRLTAALEHNIGLRSLPGKGCTFSIHVPLANELPDSPAPTPLLLTEPPVRHGTVLIIEDDEQVMESLQTLLHLWGYEVLLSQQPEPETLLAEHPELNFIISDYQLGGEKNGIELIQQFRQLAGWKIPALLITGNTSADLSEKLSKLSIPVSYKPINPALLKKHLILLTKET